MQSGINISKKEWEEIRNRKDDSWKNLIDETSHQLSKMDKNEIYEPFRPRHALDLACLIVQKLPNIEFNALMRLLYLVERACIVGEGCMGPTIGGRYFFTSFHGMIIQDVLDMATGKHSESYDWNKHLSINNGKIKLKKIPISDSTPLGTMSPGLYDIVDQTIQKFESGYLDHDLPETIGQKTGTFISLHSIATKLQGHADSCISLAKEMTIMNLLLGPQDYGDDK